MITASDFCPKPVASWRSCTCLGLELALVWIIHTTHALVFSNPHLTPWENGLEFYVLLCVWVVPLHVCPCTMCTPVQFPGSRNYIQWWSTMWVLGLNPAPLEASALKHWTTSPVCFWENLYEFCCLCHILPCLYSKQCIPAARLWILNASWPRKG